MAWSLSGALLTLALMALSAVGGWWFGRRSRSPRPGEPASSPAIAAGELEPQTSRQLRVTIESLPGQNSSEPADILYQSVFAAPESVPPAPTAIGAIVPPTKPPALELPPLAPPLPADAIRRAEPGREAAPPRSVAQEVQPPRPPERAAQALPDSEGASAKRRPWRPVVTLGGVLFWLALVVYAITRLVRLPSFPIYFFSDEAVQTVLASDFLRDGLRDYLGQVFPTYFANGSLFNLGTSVYLQVLPTLLFGKSVWVTRGAAALATLIGTAAAGLILRDIFRVRTWWMGVLILAVTPAWYLHSRTAFETSLMVSFYLWFLYFYLRYRTDAPRMLYPALLCGALAFYSYSPGQLVVVATGLLLLLSDARYHWQNRQVALRGTLVLLLLILPYVRFRITHAEETYFHLRMLDSYLLQPIPLSEKLATFWHNYRLGISPGYWYFPNNHDLSRHLMMGYGHIHRLTLPFAVVGLVLCLRSFRSPAHRVLLASLVATPLGAALVGVGVTRLLSFVVPAALITGLGVEAVVAWLTRRLPYTVLAIALFSFTSFAAFFMLNDSLQRGPTWYHDYGLGGMQYGASQLFSAVGEYVKQNPGTHVLVSPSWANATDVLRRFFLPDDAPVRLGSPLAFVNEPLNLPGNLVLTIAADELPELLASPKLTGLHVERTLPYPDGTDGFYFIRMRYAPEAAALFAAEAAERRQPITEDVMIGGQPARVTHPVLDSGNVGHIFDGDLFTLARGYDANPLDLEIEFSEPRLLHKIVATTGSMDFDLSITLYPAAGGEPIRLTQSFVDQPDDPTVEVALDSEIGPVSRLTLSFHDRDAGNLAKIHLREIRLE